MKGGWWGLVRGVMVEHKRGKSGKWGAKDKTEHKKKKKQSGLLLLEACFDLFTWDGVGRE